MVYVINSNGKPLMPCSNVIARLLLKQGKAKVVRKTPFTIKLNYLTTEYTKELVLGVDTGSSHIGVAVSDSDGNIYLHSHGRCQFTACPCHKCRQVFPRKKSALFLIVLFVCNLGNNHHKCLLPRRLFDGFA
jgi:hypothetical protein